MMSEKGGLENNLVPTVLFEDEHLLVLNKLSGLVVHSDGRTEEVSVTDWLEKNYPHLKDVGVPHTLDSKRYAPRYGLLHRIDRETSGVLLVAKTAEDFFFFQRQFLDRSIEKTYLAFVEGKMPSKEGVIDNPIGRSRIDFRKWTTGEDARGTLRPALTHYRVLEQGVEHALLELSPKTGRTHQLRVHLESLGLPIVADSRYGSPKALGFTRLALHAQKIRMKLRSGKEATFEAPLPEDFLVAQAMLEKE